MIENDLDKVLNYMKQYVENVYEHDSEPMLNWKDIKLVLEEIERLNNIINESAEEILKELEENHHLSYGVALAIRQKLLDYKELKGSSNNE